MLEGLEPTPVETPESVAKAWELEIDRRVEEIDAGLVESIPYEQVMAELRSKIESHRKRKAATNCIRIARTDIGMTPVRR